MTHLFNSEWVRVWYNLIHLLEYGVVEGNIARLLVQRTVRSYITVHCGYITLVTHIYAPLLHSRNYIWLLRVVHLSCLDARDNVVETIQTMRATP